MVTKAPRLAKLGNFHIVLFSSYVNFFEFDSLKGPILAQYLNFYGILLSSWLKKWKFDNLEGRKGFAHFGS